MKRSGLNEDITNCSNLFEKLDRLLVILVLRSLREGSLKPERTSRGIRIAESPLILIRGEDVGPMSDQPVG